MSLLKENSTKFEDRTSFGHPDLEECGLGRGEWKHYPRLPLGSMLMLGHIPHLSATGGEHGKGFARAKLHISPDLWFFRVHFKDNPVMPACLMLDGLWQLTGFTLGWLGARGEGLATGVEGPVKFTGKVQPTAQLIEYGIEVRRVRISPRMSRIIADGWLGRDGEEIATAKGLTVTVIPHAA